MSEQLKLFDLQQTARPVNIASVRQLSPFRYPGGKTWFVPVARQWMRSLQPRPRTLIEPFAGGAIISLTAAWEGLTDDVVMIERDEVVASVWKTILDPDAQNNGEWLVEQIIRFQAEPAYVQATLSAGYTTIQQQAFHTILRNRFNRGGILAAGVGLIKNGENGRGIASRWYPQTLKTRIEQIMALRERIAFIEGDGLAMLKRTNLSQSALFLDPPYTASQNGAGKRLYTHHQIDHQHLFSLAALSDCPVLMTYEDAPEVRQLAIDHGFELRSIAMKTTHHARKQELMISRDFEWYDQKL